MTKNIQTKLTNFPENFKTFPRNYAVFHPGMFWYCLNGTDTQKNTPKYFSNIFPKHSMEKLNEIVYKYFTNKNIFKKQKHTSTMASLTKNFQTLHLKTFG